MDHEKVLNRASWPLDTPEHLLDALAEQGMSREEAAQLAPSLRRLSAWQAPHSTLASRDQLMALLVSHLPAPAPAAFCANQERALVGLRNRLRGLAGVLVAQARLLRPAVWIASATAIALAVLYALALPHPAGEQDVLVLALPLVAAYGVSLIYGSDVDPFLEVVCATPISLRLLLLARLTIVFAYDAALALAATLALAALGRVGAETVWGVTQNWLGPMLLLSALALVLAQHIGSSGAISLALALWGARVVAATNDHVGLMSPAVAQFLISVWSTNALTIGCALLCVAAALSSTSGRSQRWRMT